MCGYAEIKQIDPHTITNQLIAPDFDKQMTDYIEARWSHAKAMSDEKELFFDAKKSEILSTKKALLAIAFPKLPRQEQLEKINGDISLMDYAHPDIQKNCLLGPATTKHLKVFEQYCKDQLVGPMNSKDLDLVSFFKNWQASLNYQKSWSMSDIFLKSLCNYQLNDKLLILFE